MNRETDIKWSRIQFVVGPMLAFLIVISYWVASQLMLQMQGMFLNILLNLCNPRKYFEIASLKIIDIFCYFVVCTARLKGDTLYVFFFSLEDWSSLWCIGKVLALIINKEWIWYLRSMHLLLIFICWMIMNHAMNVWISLSCLQLLWDH